MTDSFTELHSTCQTVWKYPYWNVSKTITYPNTRRGGVLLQKQWSFMGTRHSSVFILPLFLAVFLG